jgi:hypothetical protein
MKRRYVQVYSGTCAHLNGVLHATNKYVTMTSWVCGLLPDAIISQITQRRKIERLVNYKLKGFGRKRQGSNRNTYLLTELNPSWEAANCVAIHEISSNFKEPEGSSPCSQEPSAGPYPEPVRSSRNRNTNTKITWSHWGKLQETSDRMAGVPTEIRT